MGVTTEPRVSLMGKPTTQGDPVIDPSKNVFDLVQAETRRQDDLREKDNRHLKEIMELRAGYYAELRKSEADRIDAIRAVDVGAVQRAAEVSAAQAQALATQVATSAETLRGQVAAAAQAATVSLAAALEPIIKDVADLRKVQYEQAGQTAQRVETRSDARDLSGDRRANFDSRWVVMGVVGAYITTGIGVVAFLLR